MSAPKLVTVAGVVPVIVTSLHHQLIAVTKLEGVRAAAEVILVPAAYLAGHVNLFSLYRADIISAP